MIRSMLTWDSRIEAVGGAKAKGLTSGLGIETVGDLLRHYPRTYLRKGTVERLDSLVEGDWLTIFGRVLRSEAYTYQDRRSGRTAWRLEVIVEAPDGTRLSMTFFDRASHTAQWRANTLGAGRYGLFAGKLGIFRERWQLTNPQTKMYGDQDSAADAFEAVPELIAIYRETGKVQTWDIEEAVKLALELVDDFPDVLPEEVRDQQDLVGVHTALRQIHRPDSWAQKGLAEKRLVFEEAFVAQVVLARSRAALEATSAAPRAAVPGGLLDRFDQRLPFELTEGQRRVGEEIGGELARSHPMHRLLQGEVGSGKTIVALRAMLQVVDSGGQAALLAPTEVLAQQHHRSISAMLGDLGQGGTFEGADGATRVTLLTGSMSTAARKQALLEAASGEAGIVIGTHALLEDKVQFADLGLVVVDEQHRFGVEQRAALSAKAGSPPHLLVMTATPIPRTVAMTVFGDLDTSVLDQLPSGRAEVQSTVVPIRAQPAWLDRAWERIREEVANGRQAYVVCPRIGDELEPPAEGPPLSSVVDTVDELRAGPLSELRVEMLHGRLTPEEKDAVMRSFAAGEVDVLVSTTVIEVGVDVPNASVMVILDADRFGVSQLHQLRGRIGRGGHAGLCLLVTATDPAGESMERLTAVAATRDGFELSRVDLAQRREGNVLGKEQHGHHSTFKLLSVLRHEEVIEAAREAATSYVARDPELAQTPDLRAAVDRLEGSDDAAFLEMT